LGGRDSAYLDFCDMDGRLRCGCFLDILKMQYFELIFKSKEYLCFFLRESTSGYISGPVNAPASIEDVIQAIAGEFN
jgi:hypothetical protein